MQWVEVSLQFLQLESHAFSGCNISIENSNKITQAFRILSHIGGCRAMAAILSAKAVIAVDPTAYFNKLHKCLWKRY